MFKQSSEKMSQIQELHALSLSKKMLMSGTMAKRETFVGTPQYLTPEMIEKCQSGPFTDLWCLGLIVYYLEMGELPWKSKNNFERLTEIQQGKIDYPDKMSAEGRDLVRLLMNLNPLKRLGMGIEGLDMDFDTMKAHPFFKGVDFQSIVQ